MRSDHNGKFSSVLRQALNTQEVAVGIATNDTNPLNEPVGRQVLAFIRLLSNCNDHLAWRTLLKIRNNGVGPVAMDVIYSLAKAQGVRLADALRMIRDNPASGARQGPFHHPPPPQVVRAREVVAELRRLRDSLNSRGHALDVLSMGMSADFELAIAEGATHVRIGTAIFGSRP